MKTKFIALNDMANKDLVMKWAHACDMTGRVDFGGVWVTYNSFNKNQRIMFKTIKSIVAENEF